MGTALHRVETHLEEGDYAVAVFVDIAGGFSHTSPQIICKKAASREILRPIMDWMMHLLENKTRNITSTLGSYLCLRTVSMGTRRGGAHRSTEI